MSSEQEDQQPQTSFFTALVCGGLAGTSVDVALFPIVTHILNNIGNAIAYLALLGTFARERHHVAFSLLLDAS